jgi:hypothetical protein
MEDETDFIVKRAHVAKGDTPGKSNPKYGRVTEDESGNKPLPQRRRSLFKNEDVLPTETLVAHSVKVANWRNEELEAIVQYISNCNVKNISNCNVTCCIVTSDRDLVCKVNENTKEIHILIFNFLKVAIE